LLSTSSLPEACSGLMYSGVPSTMPVWVRRSSPASLTAVARPKSVSTARPFENRMLPGLMSRWTSPFPWAYSSASAISRAIASVSSTDSGPSFAILSVNVDPSTKGIT